MPGATRTEAKPNRRGPQSGSTAVEFAFVAAPLLMMIFAILELAIVYIVHTNLDNAMADASREIRTGEFQAATKGKSPAELEVAFKTNVCARMGFMQAHCATNLSVDVRTVPEFNSGGGPSPIQPDGTYNDEALGVSAGSQESRVVARAFYRWPLLTPFLDTALERIEGAAVIESIIIHQNEPFGDAA